jgi:hypothetical protein
MSLWRSLFGGGGSKSAAAAPVTAKTLEHKGYLIEAQPYVEAGQYQLAGTISKDVGGVRKSYRFVRADRFAMADDAAEMALVKGRQIIDQQGDSIFG